MLMRKCVSFKAALT